MGRTVSGTLSSILSPSSRDIDKTVEIVFSDETKRYATSTISVGGFSFANHLEHVGEVKQTLEAPTDRVVVAIQNKDQVLGQHVALHYVKWRKATAIVGRNYYQIGSTGLRTGTIAWVEMFRGAVQQPSVDDFQVRFDVIPDTTSAGDIVCARTLAPSCGFVFKDVKTCAYAGGLTTCDHTLKSTAGCEGRANTHHFGGMEHRYNPDVSVPGTGGNPDPGEGGGGIPPYCPRLDQYVRVQNLAGKPVPLRVGLLTPDEWLWNPILQRFFKVRSCRIVKDQPIWEIVTQVGAVGYSGSSHLLVRTTIDTTGRAIEGFQPGDLVLGVVDDELVDTRCLIAQDTGETGDVMFIEMDTDVPAEKIYCYGDNPEKWIVCHNWKEPLID